MSLSGIILKGGARWLAKHPQVVIDTVQYVPASTKREIAKRLLTRLGIVAGSAAAGAAANAVLGNGSDDAVVEASDKVIQQFLNKPIANEVDYVNRMVRFIAAMPPDVGRQLLNTFKSANPTPEAAELIAFIEAAAEREYSAVTSTGDKKSVENKKFDSWEYVEAQRRAVKRVMSILGITRGEDLADVQQVLQMDRDDLVAVTARL